MTTYYPISSDIKQRISDTYRFRGEHPVTGRPQWHYGVDIAAASGTRVGSYDNGKVIFAGQQKGYGNVVYIQHKDGSQTIYAHLSKIDVEKGQNIIGNQKIGEVGNTGVGTGNHLHFEFKPKGLEKGIDPSNLLKNATKTDSNIAKQIDSNIQKDQSTVNIQKLEDMTNTLNTNGKNSTQNTSNQNSNEAQPSQSLNTDGSTKNDGQNLTDKQDGQDETPTPTPSQQSTLTNVLSAIQGQLFNAQTLSIITARLIMGEDLDKICVDMATRAVLSGGIEGVLTTYNIDSTSVTSQVAQGLVLLLQILLHFQFIIIQIYTSLKRKIKKYNFLLAFENCLITNLILIINI